jgi:anti-anti-sigma factor
MRSGYVQWRMIRDACWTLHYYDDGGLRVVSIIGEFDVENRDSLQSFVEVALGGVAPVIVDLSDVTFLEATPTAVLVDLYEQARARMCFVAPRGTAIRRLFEVQGLDRALCVADSVAEAGVRLKIMLASGGSVTKIE